MDAREERGLAIARKGGIQSVGRVWQVSSQSTASAYVVSLHERKCSCPDYELRGAKCKHLFAVEYFVKWRREPDGSVTETRRVRLTYAQNWPAYNEAQTREKERVAELLRGLCAGIVPAPQVGRGRPRLPLADVTFAAVMKVYSTFSGRRASSDIRDCAARGLVDAAPHYNSVFRYLESPSLTPILTALIEESAGPLAAVETDFAVDSSGFSTSTYARYFDHKYGRVRSEHAWVKAHITTGVKTNVVTAAKITEGYDADCPELPALVATTAKRFPVAEVSADKAYLSNDNLAAIRSVGAVPFIPFKSNSRRDSGSELWRRMFYFFHYERPKFLEHYHKRSNVESTFSMIKRTLGGAVRSKIPVAQCNEVLCKLVAHNLRVLVAAIYELQIDPMFWQQQQTMRQ